MFKLVKLLFWQSYDHVCLWPLKRKVSVISGCCWSWIIRCPRLGDPAGVDQSPTCVQAGHLEVFSAASLIFLVVFLSFNPGCQGEWVSGADSALEIPYSQPWLGHSGPSNHSACRPLPAQDTLSSSARRPPQSHLPREQLVPPAPLALNSQMLGPYLAWVLCLWCALVTSTAKVNPQLPVTRWW